MFKLYIKKYMQARGYEGKMSELIRMGFTKPFAHRLLDEEQPVIRINHLYMLCTNLKCTPNDLLNFVPGIKNRLEKDHPNWKLQKKEDMNNPIEYIKRLKPEDLEDAARYLKDKAGL
jgi:DNA-binding Xre family transcriptional regulator